jgi:hypothetical protein
VNPAAPAYAVPSAASSTVNTRRTMSGRLLDRVGAVPARASLRLV